MDAAAFTRIEEGKVRQVMPRTALSIKNNFHFLLHDIRKMSGSDLKWT
ncbi:hypothetical protein [Siminovitchia fortis]|nr:hypothetical protein [Siminovitchia fortis]WHY83188.1 hypothetical protein QNH23_07395 [Siminovitchia fortis]